MPGSPGEIKKIECPEHADSSEEPCARRDHSRKTQRGAECLEHQPRAEPQNHEETGSEAVCRGLQENKNVIRSGDKREKDAG